MKSRRTARRAYECSTKRQPDATMKKTAPKTSAERQEALRRRRAQEGLTEVRGLYARPEDHAKIKAFAKGLHAPARKAAKDT